MGCLFSSPSLLFLGVVFLRREGGGGGEGGSKGRGRSAACADVPSAVRTGLLYTNCYTGNVWSLFTNDEQNRLTCDVTDTFATRGGHIHDSLMLTAVHKPKAPTTVFATVSRRFFTNTTRNRDLKK